MFGVSPAYFISRFTDRFSPEEVAKSLPDLAAAGFDSFQLEVFHPETLDAWVRRGAELVRTSAEAAGLVASQFVGHFLLHGFSTPENLRSDYGVEEMRKIIRLLAVFPECGIVTVALPAFDTGKEIYGRDAYVRLRLRFVEKIGTMLAIAEAEGKKLALEIMPGSLLDGTAGFLRLREELGSAALGYNFDTGHAWACRENLALIPARIGGASVFGTHLKDNRQTENLSLGMGRGTVPWREVIGGLMAVGYTGSWDLEIKCEASESSKEYESAFCVLRNLHEELRTQETGQIKGEESW